MVRRAWVASSEVSRPECPRWTPITPTRQPARPRRHRTGQRRPHRRTLAHLPSGRFAANNAWLACAAIAPNLTRAAGHLTGPRYAVARAATIRTRIVNVAARLAHRAGTIHLHLPEHWPWQGAWNNLFTTAYAAPT
jgi:Transposase DDE domain group 1